MKQWFNALIHKLVNSFLDLLAPRYCAGCLKEKEIFCNFCSNFSFRYGASCVFCNFRNNNGKICTKCKKDWKPNFFQVLWVGSYFGALKNAITELKYKKRKELIVPLAELIFKKFKEFYPNYKNKEFVIIPIPLHPKKERNRGFNQASLIAQEFSKLSDILVFDNILLKKIETKAQVETKTKEERIKNLESVFEIDKKKLVACGTQHTTIILIDDVVTTGATFLYASLELKKVFPNKKIFCLAIAHGYG